MWKVRESAKTLPLVLVVYGILSSFPLHPKSCLDWLSTKINTYLVTQTNLHEFKDIYLEFKKEGFQNKRKGSKLHSF